MSNPKGKIEDILVKVDKFIFLVDFLILECEADLNTHIKLGRPFLATGKTMIDVEKGELTMQMHDQKITFNILQNPRSQDRYEACNMLRALTEMDLVPLASRLGGLYLDSPIEKGRTCST